MTNQEFIQFFIQDFDLAKTAQEFHLSLPQATELLTSTPVLTELFLSTSPPINGNPSYAH